MAFDETDFVDREYESARRPASTPAAGSPQASFGTQWPGSTQPTPPSRPAPTAEELQQQYSATQQQLAKLRATQEQLERAKLAMETLRQRRDQFSNGRREISEKLDFGVAWMEKAEFEARREATQLATALARFRAAREEIQGLNESHWNETNWEQELSRGLTTIRQAHVTWDEARLQWKSLDGPANSSHPGTPLAQSISDIGRLPLGTLGRVGLALTWPLVLLLSIVASIAGWMIWHR